MGELRGKRRRDGRADGTSRLKERLGYEGIRDSADIRATDIHVAGILLNVAKLLNNTFMYFLTFIYRIVSLYHCEYTYTRKHKRGKIFQNCE